jgi:hypothetical protein
VSGYRNSAGADTDDLFDPDVEDNGYVATFMRDSNGNGLHYASASYGTPGAAIGYRDANGNDVGPQWAAKGTASYALPINGNTYTAAYSTAGSVSTAGLYFHSSTSGWSISGATTSASGAIPAGATQVKYSWSWISGNNPPNNGDTNQAASWAAITSSDVYLYLSNFQGPGQSQQTGRYSVNIQYANAAGAVISNTTIYFVCNTNPT